MPTRAPNRTSVRQNIRERNTRTPEKSRSRARCVCRLAVITDRRLSAGARLTFALIDDYAGAKGVGWPKQATIASRIGASRQQVQRWVKELERCEWISVERTGRAHRYTLRWARASDVTTGEHRIPICNPVVIIEPARPDEPPQAPEAEAPASTAPCSLCNGTGEREYIVGGGYSHFGRREPMRKWRGICGCRQ